MLPGFPRSSLVLHAAIFISFSLAVALILPVSVPVDAQLRADEILPLINAHNAARAYTNGSNMPMLSWDDGVAAIAQAYADTCPGQHSGHPGLGENLAWSWPVGTILDATNGGWIAERRNFDYNSPVLCQGNSFDPCGHYTQVIWAGSTSFGCGAAYGCRNMDGVSDPGAVFVCNFSPEGNIFSGNGELKPYELGPACSACDTSVYPYCVNGLCSKTADGSGLWDGSTVGSYRKPHTAASRRATNLFISVPGMLFILTVVGINWALEFAYRD